MSQERQSFSNVKRVGNRCNQLDTHEILKQEIYKQGYEGDSNFRFGISAPIGGGAGSVVSASNPSNAGFDDTELYFDSIYRNTSSDYSNGEIIWSITLLNNNQPLSNVIEMHLGKFFFPKIYPDPGKPEFFYYRRAFLECVSAPSTQAVLGPSGQRFHFEFEVLNLTGQAVEFKPIRDSIFFQRPITSLTDFQVRFSVPQTTSAVATMKRAPIPHETVTLISLLTAGVGYNPIRFQITGFDTTSVLGPIGSLGAPGVAVFITGYVSNDAATNTSVNSLAGVFATTVIDATTFEIAGIDATAVTAQYTATMYIPKNRIAFPVRFTSVRDQPTNYIQVGHE